MQCERARWFRPKFVNGFEQKGWEEGPYVDEYANTLGEDGWELVSFEPAPLSSEHLSLVFKRPKE